MYKYNSIEQYINMYFKKYIGKDVFYTNCLVNLLTNLDYDINDFKEEFKNLNKLGCDIFVLLDEAERVYLYAEVFSDKLFTLKGREIQLKEKFIELSARVLEEDKYLFEKKSSHTKKGFMREYIPYFKKETIYSLMKENRILPSYGFQNAKFSEDELIVLIENVKQFKSKTKILGGDQESRENICNHLLKTQTVSLKVLKKMISIAYPTDADLFLRKLAKRSITMKNIEQDDSFIQELIDAGATLKYIDANKASNETKLLIEVLK